MPPITRDQQKAGLVKIIEDFNREGMTGAKDPGIGERKWELYGELLKEGKLTVRVFALWAGAAPPRSMQPRCRRASTPTRGRRSRSATASSSRAA